MVRAMHQIARREFLSRASRAAAATLLAHDALAAGGPAPAVPGAPVATAEPRIREIRLLTSTPLAEMRRFYESLLGFPVIESRADLVAFGAGATRLEFRPVAPGEPGAEGAFYHFAFNIPRNKIRLAREWQLERTPLVPTPIALRDPDYPDDVRHFSHWNAHSVFFFDPAFNIVEYIARHDLPGDAPGPFTAADILYASEIGFVVEDPGSHARRLHERLGLEAYPRGTDNWWAMGDERGLVLCLPKGRVFGENTATPKAFDVFPTGATIRAARADRFGFEAKPYDLIVEP